MTEPERRCCLSEQALSLEEEQSRRCWSEELSVLAVPEKAQRAVFVDHLLRGMEEAAAALKRQLWAIVRREEVRGRQAGRHLRPARA